MTVSEFMSVLRRDVEQLRNNTLTGVPEIASALAEATPQELENLCLFLDHPVIGSIVGKRQTLSLRG